MCLSILRALIILGTDSRPPHSHVLEYYGYEAGRPIHTDNLLSSVDRGLPSVLTVTNQE